MKNFSSRLMLVWLLSTLPLLIVAQPLPLPTQAQMGQIPNLISPAQGVQLEASSVDRERPLRHMFYEPLTLRWETTGEKEGAWIAAKWEELQTLREIWIVNQPTPYDILLETESRSANFPAPRRVKIEFSDGTSQEVELRLGRYYQILALPQPKETKSLKITILTLWDNSTEQRTGLGKVKVFAENFQSSFEITFFPLYRVQGEVPVQSAKIEIINPAEALAEARLQVFFQGENYATLPLEEIPARSVSIQQIWIPAPYVSGQMSFSIQCSTPTSFAVTHQQVTPYQKDYFDGGVFQILNTNHNDLGFLDTQFVTADYRSNEQIAPALDLMRDHPQYTYSMESVVYLKEFLDRFPQRTEEIAQRMREGRFQFGASYVQNLPVHVGPEKLVRQFYYGRRWLLENFPGVNTRTYSNVDVPGISYQLPQILRKSGVDYIIQGRFPWGFYYWEGLDGTSIPLFAPRYTSSRMLLNPVNHTGWLRFQQIREPYYRQRQLPKQLIYDFNSDYLPPAPEMIPFVAGQNREMAEFALQWNDHFCAQPEQQIRPSRLEFSTPDRALDQIFGAGRLRVETIKGDWPMSWAYFDEPGHREGLLMGRHAHNHLVKAEGLSAWLKTIDQHYHYPQDRLDQGWLANCWPDHGWGGNRGVVTDSINIASYRASLEVGSTLSAQAGEALAALVPQRGADYIPLVVYNTSGWERDDLVQGTFTYPQGWSGIEIIDHLGEKVAYELVNHDLAQHLVSLSFEVYAVPSLGYRVYYARRGAGFSGTPIEVADQVLENTYLKVTLGRAGITSLYDKVNRREVLTTDKFEGGEVIQFTAPGVAWNDMSEVTTHDFDQTARYGLKTIRATQSPIRTVIEKEAQFPDFTLRERFILRHEARELIVEADLLAWKGTRDRELRIVFPMNNAPDARISYGIPFGTVEMNRDEIDYSNLPQNVETLWVPGLYARRDLPFREAINWVDVSQGRYQGSGCLLASDMSVHLFKDQSDQPVAYPLVQHVLLSTRKSLAWNPENWFEQPGDHHYRMALYPHEDNWRKAYRQAEAFNQPLALYTASAPSDSSGVLPVEQSFFEIEPSNVMLSTVKQAEDGMGVVVRLYEAEGRYSQLKLRGFKPFSRVHLTNLIEYNEKEIPVDVDGTLNMELQPWEIITLRIKME